MAELLKVLLLDDNPEYLEDKLPYYGYEVVCAQSTYNALKIIENNSNFDIILLDVEMEQLNGWSILKKLRNNSMLENIAIIVVTNLDDNKKIVQALKLGADDYVLKPVFLPNLLARMEAVLRRTKKTKSTAADSVNKKVNQTKTIKLLTQREKDVLLLVAQGLTNKDISEKLFLSPTTVKAHLNSIFHKLDVKTRIQAVIAAQEINSTVNQ